MATQTKPQDDTGLQGSLDAQERSSAPEQAAAFEGRSPETRQHSRL